MIQSFLLDLIFSYVLSLYQGYLKRYYDKCKYKQFILLFLLLMTYNTLKSIYSIFLIKFFANLQLIVDALQSQERGLISAPQGLELENNPHYLKKGGRGVAPSAKHGIVLVTLFSWLLFEIDVCYLWMLSSNLYCIVLY